MSSTAARRSNMRPSPVSRSHTHGDGGSRMSSATSADFHRAQRSQDVEIEGVYKNSAFTFHLTTLLGCTVEVHVKNDKRYEGILKTFSSELEVVLDCVHLLDPANRDKVPAKDNIIDTLIINFADLVTMTAVNADTRYGETDSFTDAAISKSQVNGIAKERELTPYIIDTPGLDLEHSLDELGSNADWTPEKMFQHHEQVFGVKSDFNEEDYTTKLPSADTPDFQQKLAVAGRMAAQIEGSSSSRRNAAIENDEGRDEEARFSAVTGSPSTGVSNRYTPPQIRNRDKQGGSKALLSQSMRVNGRDGLAAKNGPEKHKSVASPTEDIEKLKKWNNKFNLKPTESQPAVKENKVEAATPTRSAKSPPPVTGQLSNAAKTATTAVSQAATAGAQSPPVSASTSVTSESKSPSSAESVTSEVDDVARNSNLNPEAKEFVFKPPTAVVPSPVPPPQQQPPQQQPPLQQPPPQQQQQPQQQYNSKSNKTVTVSLLDSRQPAKSVEMGTSGAGSFSGVPLQQQQHPGYIVMAHPPNTRFQRMASYPGNEAQQGQPHNIPNPASFLPPHPFVPNGHAAPVMSGQQQMGHMTAPSHTHNGQMHHSMPPPAGPPPNVMTNPTAPSGAQMHPQGPAAYNPGAYHVNQVYQIPAQSGGPQQAAGAQPPLQQSPHNPSPSPAPMTNGNGSAVSYASFPQVGPPPQQFYPTSMGPHTVSQAQSYPQPQQVLYIHPGAQMHGQFSTPIYPQNYPMSGYPQNFPGNQ